MKKRKKQIAKLLKLGVFLFGISLLLWNCEDETIEKQENNIATVGLEEALNLFKATSSAKLHTNTYFVAHLEKIHQEDIINSEERLTIIPVSTKDSGYYSRIVLLKVNGNIQSVIFSMYPSSTKKETNDFTGEIIITDLEGNFLKGYRANSGNLITKFTKKVLSVNKSSKGGVCPDHGECTANSLCVYCTQELDEVVVSGNTSGGSAPVDYILDFSGTGPDDGSSGDPNTSMGWDYGDGGGGTLSNTTEDQIINKLTNKCAKTIFSELENGIFENDPIKPEVQVTTENFTKLNFSESILKLFDDSSKTHYTIQNGATNGSAATTLGATTTISDNYLSNATKLSIARTMIHESVHAYINALYSNVIQFNSFTFRQKIEEYAKNNGYTIGTNRFHHEFMGQYVNAMAYSLYEWDMRYGSGKGKTNITKPDDLLGWDYYYAMAFGGLFYKDSSGNLIETDSFKKLIPNQSDRDKIKQILKNEQNGNSSAKGQKC
ncbi:hypothetical protein [Tenacibaculum ascidiaceicola]|uniref:hypothetical protein n=1 Tax=Tenacibaculum ascidiaceicola TaxID=1699411 RepID=UPI003CE56A5C